MPANIHHVLLSPLNIDTSPASPALLVESARMGSLCLLAFLVPTRLPAYLIGGHHTIPIPVREEPFPSAC